MGWIQYLKEDDLDNILVRQKDRIIKMIHKRQLGLAKAALDTVEELWSSTNYAYKLTELRETLKRARRKENS
jgi:hypothetical protein